MLGNAMKSKCHPWGDEEYIKSGDCQLSFCPEYFVSQFGCCFWMWNLFWM